MSRNETGARDEATRVQGFRRWHGVCLWRRSMLRFVAVAALALAACSARPRLPCPPPAYAASGPHGPRVAADLATLTAWVLAGEVRRFDWVHLPERGWTPARSAPELAPAWAALGFPPVAAPVASGPPPWPEGEAEW